MVQGMAFLSKKGFNPQNNSNRKQVYEAQQASKLEKERIRKREQQLKKERDDEELCQATGRGTTQLRFMYDAPPGLEGKKNKPDDGDYDEGIEPSSTNNSQKQQQHNDVTKAQPGDDAAAAAFRQMFATANQNNNQDEGDDINYNNGRRNQKEQHGFAPVLQGSNFDALAAKMEEGNTNKDGAGDARSALEKAVGRRDRGGALTLDEQIARFPQLKNAPMAKGMSATDVNVSFKPLGAQMRNVKCLACGVWGHSRGDRECTKSGWDPFAARAPTAAAAASASSIMNNKPVPPSTNRPSRDATASSSSSKRDRRKKGDDDDLSRSRSRSYSSDSYSSDDSRRHHRKREKRRRKERSSKHHDKKKKKRHSSSRDDRRHRKRRSDYEDDSRSYSSADDRRRSKSKKRRKVRDDDDHRRRRRRDY